MPLTMLAQAQDAGEQAALDKMALLHHQLASCLTKISGRAQLLELMPDLPPHVLQDARCMAETALEAGRLLVRLHELADTLRQDQPPS